MIAKHPTQRLMQQMCGRVIGANGVTARRVNFLMHQIIHRNLSGTDCAMQHMHIAEALLRIGNLNHQAVFIGHHAGIAHLAAAFGIKRRLIEHQRHLIALTGRADRRAVFDNRQHLALGGG